MNKLPERYCERMKELLGEEYDEYIDSLSEKSCTAFRINTGKVSIEQWERRNPFSTRVVSWVENGFYYNEENVLPSKHPYYYAGLYYIQEASAMIPASILPIEEGDRVLDLCAAPGGKSTELGARLRGQGLLVANDISVSRTRALVKNIQLAGICNAVVTAETPERLASVFAEYFDKILVDAPCSGEGMFRREPGMVKDWMEKGPEYYAPIQKQILKEAYKMLKPGGKLVYSTCTFSPQENEETIQWLITEYPDMKICPVERRKGFSDGLPKFLEHGSDDLKNCIRIFPHRTEGEGHFAVLLQKKDSEKAVDLENQSEAGIKESSDKAGIPGSKGSSKKQKISYPKELASFLEKREALGETLVTQGDTLYLRPTLPISASCLRIVYQGLPICEQKYKCKMSHSLALTMKSDDYGQVINLPSDDGEIFHYLKGETLLTKQDYQGNVLVCVDGFGVGWAQGTGRGMLKNKYHTGWRYQ